MEKQEILDTITDFIQDDKFYEFSDEFLKKITIDEAEFISESSKKIQMFKLPQSEIDFFLWLKENDPKVWNDLWGNLEETPYLVSNIFLPIIKDNSGRGFPICDLLDEDNYYFTESHVVDEESKVFIDVAKRKLDKSKRMTTEELLMLEISAGPIDIWHFAYKFKLDLDTCKKAVETLKEDGALVHLTDSEHLAPFIDL